jgi:RimJ/RimL family protein N-acetyltransferase
VAGRRDWVHPCARYWGAGYATEAARATLRFGFTELHLHRIFGVCQAANGASARILAKLGIRQEAYLRESEWTKGQWRDIVLYALLDHEWAAQVGDHH